MGWIEYINTLCTEYIFLTKCHKLSTHQNYLMKQRIWYGNKEETLNEQKPWNNNRIHGAVKWNVCFFKLSAAIPHYYCFSAAVQAKALLCSVRCMCSFDSELRAPIVALGLLLFYPLTHWSHGPWPFSFFALLPVPFCQAWETCRLDMFTPRHNNYTYRPGNKEDCSKSLSFRTNDFLIQGAVQGNIMSHKSQNSAAAHMQGCVT